MTNSDMILKALLQARIDAFEEVVKALEQITPFAFSCECDGSDEDCAQVRKDPYANGANDTVERLRKRITFDIEATGQVLAKIKD